MRPRALRLLAVLSGMPPASGRAYDENAPCPLMELLLHRAALKEGIVLDVGANGGCEMTAALRQGRRVVGVECLESAYHELLHTPHIQEHPNATLLHVCASNRIRMAELNIASDSSSLIAANVAAGRELKKVPKVGRVWEPVVLAPLDKLLPPGERVAVIKVDVQGAEYEVLQGLLQTISRDHPVIGYEDTSDFKKNGEVDLAQLGYTCSKHGSDQVCSHGHRRRSVPSATQAAQGGRRSFTSSSSYRDVLGKIWTGR